MPLVSAMRKKCVCNATIAMNNVYIGLSGLLSVIGLVAAYNLGRMKATPKAQWQKGGILDFGWEAWKIPLVVMVALTAVLNVVWPLLKSLGMGRIFTGFGAGMYRGGGGGGRMYGGGGGYGGGGYSAAY